jgi:hypothetical protein
MTLGVLVVGQPAFGIRLAGEHLAAHLPGRVPVLDAIGDLAVADALLD